jgi:hypothetical protein
MDGKFSEDVHIADKIYGRKTAICSGGQGAYTMYSLCGLLRGITAAGEYHHTVQYLSTNGGSTWCNGIFQYLSHAYGNQDTITYENILGHYTTPRNMYLGANFEDPVSKKTQIGFGIDTSFQNNVDQLYQNVREFTSNGVLKPSDVLVQAFGKWVLQKVRYAQSSTLGPWQGVLPEKKEKDNDTAVGHEAIAWMERPFGASAISTFCIQGNDQTSFAPMEQSCLKMGGYAGSTLDPTTNAIDMRTQMEQTYNQTGITPEVVGHGICLTKEFQWERIPGMSQMLYWSSFNDTFVNALKEHNSSLESPDEIDAKVSELLTSDNSDLVPDIHYYDSLLKENCTYKLAPGNTLDSLALVPALARGVDKIVCLINDRLDPQNQDYGPSLTQAFITPATKILEGDINTLNAIAWSCHSTGHSEHLIYTSVNSQMGVTTRYPVKIVFVYPYSSPAYEANCYNWGHGDISSLLYRLRETCNYPNYYSPSTPSFAIGMTTEQSNALMNCNAWLGKNVISQIMRAYF